MDATSTAALLSTSLTTGYGYITALFGPTLTAVLAFIVIGGIFALIVGGVGSLFRHK